MKNILFALVLVSSSSLGGPMGFKDSTMLMGDFGPNWREAWLNYAVSPRDALGVGSVWMRSDDRLRSRQLSELTYTRRLMRINSEDSQANLWLLAGLGTIVGNDFSGARTMFAPGLAFDYETTRIYFSATARLYRAPQLNHDYAALRAGFSFYEAGYDDTQPWFVLEARRMRTRLQLHLG